MWCRRFVCHVFLFCFNVTRVQLCIFARCDRKVPLVWEARGWVAFFVVAGATKSSSSNRQQLHPEDVATARCTEVSVGRVHRWGAYEGWVGHNLQGRASIIVVLRSSLLFSPSFFFVCFWYRHSRLLLQRALSFVLLKVRA